ncbi:hypothetical protein RBB50_004392 [Rhinocladiella similis]
MSAKLKTVLITGCSAGGIGGALAEAFHECGYHVFATARTPSKITKSLATAPKVTVLRLDVLSSDSIREAVESVKSQTGGKLDVLVNNSGGGLVLPALDTSIEEGKRLFDLNFWAPFAVTQAFAPLLIDAKGCLVNNASISGAIPMLYNSNSQRPPRKNQLTEFVGMYSASKAALISASETFRLELARFDVRTITLISGGVKTKFFDNNQAARLPDGSFYENEKEFIYGLSDGRLQASAVNSKDYAHKVVREVEKGTSGKLWVGSGAGGAQYAVRLLPQWILVSD